MFRFIEQTKKLQVNCAFFIVVLMQILLCANDISTNPGPNQITEKMLKSMFDDYEKRIESTFSRQLDLRMNTFCDQLFSKVEQTIQAITSQVEILQRKTLDLEENYYEMFSCNKSLTQNLSHLEERMMNLVSELDQKIDRLEGFSRRDNLKFFNVPVSPNENYESCARKIVDLLQEILPYKTWTLDDIVRAHRLGYTNRDTSSRPAPLIVRFAKWADKMNILTKGRDQLRQKGIGVAGDLTTRQQNTIKDYRDRGQRAYFKGNKLIVAGPLQSRPPIHRSYADAARHSNLDMAPRQRYDHRRFPPSQPARRYQPSLTDRPTDPPARQQSESILPSQPDSDLSASDDQASEDDDISPNVSATPTEVTDSSATPLPSPSPLQPRSKQPSSHREEPNSNEVDSLRGARDKRRDSQTPVPDQTSTAQGSDTTGKQTQKVSAKNTVTTRSQSVSNERTQQSRLPTDWVSRPRRASDVPSPDLNSNTKKKK